MEGGDDHGVQLVAAADGGSGGPGTPQPTAPADAQAPPTPLPALHMNDVPLKDLAGRLIRAADFKFQELLKTYVSPDGHFTEASIEGLPSAAGPDRQRQLLQYALSQRDDFEKLLVLTRFGRKAKDWQQVMNVHGLIDRRTECMARAGHDLRAMISQLRARVETSAPDVLGALDILTNKTYTQLPRILKDNLPKKPPARSDTKAILHELDKLIRRRIELEIIPDAMRANMVIEKGCVTFRVENRFQLALTLVGHDFSLPWRIVELEFFVQSADSYKGLFSGLLGHQKYAILQQTQLLIEQVQKRDPRGPGFTEPGEAAAEQSAPASPTANANVKKDLQPPSHGDTKRHTMSDGAANEIEGATPRSKPKKRKTVDIAQAEAMEGKKPINRKTPKSSTVKEKGKKKGVKKEKQTVATGESASPADVPVAAAPGVPDTQTPEPPPPPKPAPPKLHNPYPILYAYEYLNKLLLRVQLEILTAQAHSLARDRWHKLLKVEELRDLDTVRLTYWSHPIPRPDPRTVPAGFKVPHRYYVMELAIKTDPPARNRAFGRWADRRSKGRGYLKHLNKDLVAANLFGDAVRPRTRFDIRCYSVVPDLAGRQTIEPLVNPETRAPIVLALNPSRLDLGALLTNVTDLQARFLLHRVRNLLVGSEESRGLSAVRLISRVTCSQEQAKCVQRDEDSAHQATFRWDREIRENQKPASPPLLPEAVPPKHNAPGSSSQSFRTRDVQLHEWAPSGDPTEAMQCELAVILHKDVMASAKVDTWTGRVLLTPPGGATRGSGSLTPLESVLEQRLNDHPEDAAEIFLYMRYSSFMEQISTWCAQLGLKASIASPLQDGEESRATGFPIQNKIFVRVAGFKEAWILIAVAGSEDWDAAAGGGVLAGAPSLATTSAAHAGTAEFRIWLVETTFESQSVRRYGRARREMNRTIVRATPIRARDVFALDVAGRYRDARKVDDLTRWKPPEPVAGWDHLDPCTLAAIERMCRLQHALNRVAAGLDALHVQYCYLSPDGSSALYAEEIDAADRARLAGKERRICVPEEDLAVAMGKGALVKGTEDDGDDSKRATQLPFGNLYLSVERHQNPGHDTGDGSFASADLGVGRPTQVRGIKIHGICPVKLGIAHGLLVQRDVATDRWIYKSSMEAITFNFDGVGLLDRCSSIIINELIAIGAIAELAQQVASHRTRLANIGVTVDPFDLQSLSLTYNNTLRVRVWAVATGRAADGVAKNGPLHTYCAEMAYVTPLENTDQVASEATVRHQIPSEMVTSIQNFWLQTLNEIRDLPRAFLILWHLAPLLRLVHDLTRKRNASVHTVAPGGESTFVTVKFHTLTHVQLIYGAQHGVELAMLPTGHFAFYDSTLLPGRQRVGGGAAGGGLSVNQLTRPQPPDPAIGLGPIPLFNGLIKGIGRAAMGPEFPVGTSAMPVSFGVSFHPAMLDFVVNKMDTHLNNVSLLLWIENEAAKRLPIPRNSHKNTHVDLPNMCATINTDARSVILKVSATNSWEVGLSPRAQENAVTEDLLNILADLVAEKINNLPFGTDLRPFLLFFLDFLSMPTKVVTNLLCIARDERRFANVPEEGVVAEWCFAIPPGAPAYIGPPNAPGTEFDPTLNRISIIFRITNLQTSRSLLVPLRYNYQTDVIGRWQGNNADDFTGVQEMNPFMLETMQRAYLSDTFTGLMAKVMMNYTDEILRISKLATLIRIAVKRCKTAPAGLDWVLG
ncbi:Mediator of RNA polymerase II transcription subunit 14 [Geranomyces michiganensis]|nr:Mediator of RNA polymerase II transcription subunit 14 [Geranomyces michiganensis]